MKCTSCKQGRLEPGYIDTLFSAYTCDKCGGNWIYLVDYLSWQQNAEDFDVSGLPTVAIEAEDTQQALLCPVTGSLMLKYRICHDSNHRLDLSPAVNGIWLDRGEWQLLKNRGLATSLNKIFTAPWQKQVRDDSAKATFEGLYDDKFSEQGHAKLKTLRDWLADQNQRAAMIAYLAAVDPYSANK